MWLVTSDVLRVLAASLLVGISIKIMDDCVDLSYDQAIGAINTVQTFGVSIIGYAMLALLVACTLHLHLSIGLFSAAYVVGMRYSKDVLYPSRLSARGESIVVVLLCIAYIGLRLTLISLCIMAMAQLIDNWCDENKGPEYILAAVGLCAVAMLIETQLTSLVLFSYAMFFALERWWKRCLQ